MRMMCIGDVGGPSIDSMERAIANTKPDLLVFAGDGLRRFALVPSQRLVDVSAACLASHLDERGKADWKGRYGRIRIGRPENTGELDARFFEHAYRLRFGDDGEHYDVLAAPMPSAVATVPDCRGDVDERVRTVHESPWFFWIRRRPVAHPHDGWLELAWSVPLGMVGVLGNGDRAIDRLVLEQFPIVDLDALSPTIDNESFLGLAGAPISRRGGGLRYEEGEALGRLQQRTNELGQAPILVTHAPPRGCLDETRRGDRAGSHAVRDFIMQAQPPLVVCGHVHAQGGRSARLGNSLVVNVASGNMPDDPLNYAVIERRDTGWHCELRQERSRSLVSIAGIGESTAALLHARGVRDIDALATLTDDAVSRQLGPRRGPALRRGAKAWVSGAPQLIAAPTPLPRRRLLLDVETMWGDRGDVWMAAVKPPDGTAVVQYEAVDPEDRSRLLAHLSAQIEAHPQASITTWGSYDASAIGQAYSEEGMQRPSWLNKARWFDAHAWLVRNASLPIQSRSLKEVARYVGFEARHPELDGGQVGQMRLFQVRLGAELDLEAIREYNEDDVLALDRVLDWFDGLLVKPPVLAAQPAARATPTRPHQTGLVKLPRRIIRRTVRVLSRLRSR